MSLYRHFLMGFRILNEDELADIPVEQLGFIAPVTCEFLDDTGLPHPPHEDTPSA